MQYWKTFHPFQLDVIWGFRKYAKTDSFFCIKYRAISEINLMESWKVMHVTLFSLSRKWLVLITSECHENKASGQSSYVQLEEKNQPSGGLERSRNRAPNRNRHDIEIVSRLLCWSDLGSPWSAQGHSITIAGGCHTEEGSKCKYSTR